MGISLFTQGLRYQRRAADIVDFVRSGVPFSVKGWGSSRYRSAVLIAFLWVLVRFTMLIREARSYLDVDYGHALAVAGLLAGDGVQ